MDPDANLEEMLTIARVMGQMTFNHNANRLAELVLALDEWIRKGGFLPKAWERKEPNPVAR